LWRTAGGEVQNIQQPKESPRRGGRLIEMHGFEDCANRPRKSMTIGEEVTRIATRAGGASPDRRGPGSINPDNIVDGAIELAETLTLDDVTTPVLSEHLGVKATSIRWHFHHNEDLLIAMTDRVMRTCEFPAPYFDARDWRESLGNHARAIRSILLGRPIVIDLVLIRGALGTRIRRMAAELTEQALTGLTNSGLSPEEACRTISLLSVHVRGSVVLERLERLTHTARSVEVDNRCAHGISGISSGTSPLAVRRAGTDRRIAVPSPSDSEFEYGLRCILGVRRQTDHLTARSSHRRAVPE
jgi:AcrR family transcriptional regulator